LGVGASAADGMARRSRRSHKRADRAPQRQRQLLFTTRARARRGKGAGSPPVARRVPKYQVHLGAFNRAGTATAGACFGTKRLRCIRKRRRTGEFAIGEIRPPRPGPARRSGLDAISPRPGCGNRGRPRLALSHQDWPIMLLERCRGSALSFFGQRESSARLMAWHAGGIAWRTGCSERP
jgi:hypothetical protein